MRVHVVAQSQSGHGRVWTWFPAEDGPCINQPERTAPVTVPEILLGPIHLSLVEAEALLTGSVW
jgi:hypothetical protein